MIDRDRLDRPPTLTAATAMAIRDAILTGDLGPDQPLPEVQLSESLDVSRSTVREALRHLHEDGLVNIVPHCGAFVTTISKATAWEVYTLRALLEPYAVRLAMEHHGYSEEDLNALDALVQRLGNLQREGDVIEATKVDVEFHHLLCEPSHHQLLLRTLRSLHSQNMLFIVNTKLYDTLGIPDEDAHRVIVEALRCDDPAYAEEVVRRHVETYGTALVARIAEMQGDIQDSRLGERADRHSADSARPMVPDRGAARESPKNVQ
jgi:DNA-binding GntR family transcriptional regulator